MPVPSGTPTPEAPDNSNINEEGGILVDEGDVIMVDELPKGPICGKNGNNYDDICDSANKTGLIDVAYDGPCDQERCQSGEVRPFLGH